VSHIKRSRTKVPAAICDNFLHGFKVVPAARQRPIDQALPECEMHELTGRKSRELGPR